MKCHPGILSPNGCALKNLFWSSQSPPLGSQCPSHEKKLKCLFWGVQKQTSQRLSVKTKEKGSLILISCGLNKLAVILEMQPVFLPMGAGEWELFFCDIISFPVLSDRHQHLNAGYTFLACILMSNLIWWVRISVLAAKKYDQHASIILFHLRNHYCFRGIRWIDEYEIWLLLVCMEAKWQRRKISGNREILCWTK